MVALASGLPCGGLMPCNGFKDLLVALVIFIPLFAAAGFLRMAASRFSPCGPPLSAGPHAVIAKVTLAAWKDYLTMVYLGAVFATFLLAPAACPRAAAQLASLLPGREVEGRASSGAAQIDCPWPCVAGCCLLRRDGRGHCLCVPKT